MSLEAVAKTTASFLLHPNKFNEVFMEIAEFVTLDNVFANIDYTQPLAFDTETDGLYGTITLCQFYQKHWKQVKLVKEPEPFDLVLGLSGKPELNIVMQNSSYDITVMQRQSRTRFIPDLFNDTLLLARLFYPHLDSYKLDELIKVAKGIDPYAAAKLDKAALQKTNWKADRLTEDQIAYASFDVYYLLDLYEEVKAVDDTLLYKLDILSLRHALDFQNNGVFVDNDKRIAMLEANKAKIKELAVPINVNSFKQVREYIGSEQSDDDGLAKQSLLGNDKAIKVRQTRKLTKINQFLDKYSSSDEYIYGCFAPLARSGRFTCSNDNLQQTPNAVRSIFTAPNPDYYIVYADYSQLELRCIAAITGDATMVQLFKDGADIHNYTAKMVFGEGFTPTQRQIAKTCNFNLLYGGAAEKLQTILMKSGLLLSIPELAIIINKWKNLFKTIVQWQQAGVRSWKMGRLGSTPFGRQYKAKLYTDFLNIENQGFGSEVAKLALHRMKPRLDELDKLYRPDISYGIRNFVHDSYCTYAPVNNYEEPAEIIAKAMQNAWFESCGMAMVKDIKMPVDVKIGTDLGSIESGKFIKKLQY